MWYAADDSSLFSLGATRVFRRGGNVDFVALDGLPGMYVLPEPHESEVCTLTLSPQKKYIPELLKSSGCSSRTMGPLALTHHSSRPSPSAVV